jgi:hypothetical protein
VRPVVFFTIPQCDFYVFSDRLWKLLSISGLLKFICGNAYERVMVDLQLRRSQRIWRKYCSPHAAFANECQCAIELLAHVDCLDDIPEYVGIWYHVFRQRLAAIAIPRILARHVRYISYSWWVRAASLVNCVIQNLVESAYYLAVF